MKNEAMLYAANHFWAGARSRVMSIARREGIPAVIQEHDDEFLFDLYDNGATIPDDIKVVKELLEYVGMVPDEPLEILTKEITQVWVTPGILPANDNCRLAPDILRGVWGRAYKAGVCWLRVREGWVHEKSVLVQEAFQSPEVKPQTPDQADDAPGQPTAAIAELLSKYFDKIDVHTWRTPQEVYTDCIIEVYRPGDVWVVRYETYYQKIVWSHYATDVALNAYLHAIIQQEHLDPLPE